MEYLTRSDETLLLAIWRLKENAYAVPIIKEIKTKTSKSLSPGALWVSLDNLAKKGYLKKNLAESTQEIGGRGKLYYQLTSEGRMALREVNDLNSVLWDGLSGDLIGNI